MSTQAEVKAERVAATRKLAEEGQTVAQIAEALGVSSGTAQRYVAEAMPATPTGPPDRIKVHSFTWLADDHWLDVIAEGGPRVFRCAVALRLDEPMAYANGEHAYPAKVLEVTRLPD